MQNKFEQLIELFINEDEKKAKELFHDIVVEKSRDIYAELIKEEDGIEDEETDEDAVDEDHIEEDETEEELGGNETQDLINDIASDESGLANEEESDEEEIDELQDAIADLQQQFDEIVAINDLETGDEEEGEVEGDPEMDMPPMEPEMEEPVEEEQIVEYAEKAPTPVSTEEGSVNTASQKNGNNKPSTSAKAVISSGEEKGGATPKYTTQTDAADPKGSTMSKA